VPPGAKIPLLINGASAASLSRLAARKPEILRLARLETAEAGDGTVPPGSVQIVLDEAMLVLPLAGVIDLAAERTRLQRELAKAENEISRFASKLDNQKFLAKAPEHVIEQQRERRREAEDARTKLASALERLPAA